MNTNPSLRHPTDRSTLTAGILKRVLQLTVYFLIQAAVLAVASGRLDWINAWAYLAIYLLLIIINAAIMLPRDPELIVERAEGTAGMKSWDRYLTTLYSLFGLGILLTAGLEKRWGGLAPVPIALVIVGTLVYAGGFALVSWAMASNHFFSGVVRIQTERGHRVASGGPYAFVRHPGYLGMGLSGLAIAVMLESYWALLPAVLLVVVIVIRTALEDMTLQAELPGYADYAGRVRYRLLPGIW
jgi:protein-S-isoprenylcysteine O-methyltransferase Ste14